MPKASTKEFSLGGGGSFIRITSKVTLVGIPLLELGKYQAEVRHLSHA